MYDTINVESCCKLVAIVLIQSCQCTVDFMDQVRLELAQRKSTYLSIHGGIPVFANRIFLSFKLCRLSENLLPNII